MLRRDGPCTDCAGAARLPHPVHSHLRELSRIDEQFNPQTVHFPPARVPHVHHRRPARHRHQEAHMSWAGALCAGNAMAEEGAGAVVVVGATGQSEEEDEGACCGTVSDGAV
jgi:hypothetical protein